MTFRITFAALALTVSAALAGCWKDNEEGNHGNTDTFLPGQGIVSFTGYEPLSDRPIHIHYYIPSGYDMSAMRILFVLPGTNRNADDYLIPWIDIARSKGIMVFSLEFPSAHYTETQYTQGGMFSGGTLLPESQWTFSIMEPLFDHIKRGTGSTRGGYDLFGHSAGAQFVHRFMTFKPSNSIDRGVSANAGWYTVPDFTIAFPYGLKDSPATQAGLTAFFAKRFYLHLGTADTDPNDPNLNTSAGAMAQGAYRYARGLHYWDKAQAVKGSNPFNWTKQEAVGVAHEYRRMITSAAQFLY